jgi:hypothetical protein
MLIKEELWLELIIGRRENTLMFDMLGVSENLTLQESGSRFFK